MRAVPALVFAVAALAVAVPPPVQAQPATVAEAEAALPPAAVRWARARAKRPIGPLERLVEEAESYAVPNGLNDADIEAMCFIVLMQAAKSSREDLKAVMARVKAINRAKAEQRRRLRAAQEAQAADKDDDD